MLFNSIDFLIFFPVVVLFYFALPKRVRWIWLLGASYYFYMSWNPRYAVLIALWLMAAAQQAQYLSVVVCFAAFLANDLYGFISWRRMERLQRIERYEP